MTWGNPISESVRSSEKPKVASSLFRSTTINSSSAMVRPCSKSLFWSSSSSPSLPDDQWWRTASQQQKQLIEHRSSSAKSSADWLVRYYFFFFFAVFFGFAFRAGGRCLFLYILCVYPLPTTFYDSQMKKRTSSNTFLVGISFLHDFLSNALSKSTKTNLTFTNSVTILRISNEFLNNFLNEYQNHFSILFTNFASSCFNSFLFLFRTTFH